MSQREALLLLLVLAAAFLAAFSFRVAAHPADLHDPEFAESFETARRAHPVLGAVRVRSALPDAAHLLRVSSHGKIRRVIEPERVVRTFRYGRLLFATKAELRAVRDAVRRGEFPASLPAMPEIRQFFRDRRGPYSCDAIPSGDDGVAFIRDTLPDAVLSGEPVTHAAERDAASDLPRALILVLFAVHGWLTFRRRPAERRLLAAVLSLALLGSFGWGVDVWSVLALALATGAPFGPALLAGAPCVLFPALALKRLGLVFLVSGVVRWKPLPEAVPGRARGPALLLAGLIGAGAALLWTHEPASRVPAGLRGEPAAAFVERESLAGEAAAFRAAGLKTVVGDADPVPPDADLESARMLTEIFRRAERLAEKDPRFIEVRDGAAVERLYWPRDLRARMRTDDDRAVLWAQEPGVVDHPEFVSAELYRLRGEAGLRRDGRVAALLIFLIGGCAVLAGRGRREASAVLLVRFLGVAAGACVLLLAERGALFVNPEAAYPLLAMGALAPSGVALLGLVGAVAGMFSALLWPAAGLAVCVGCGWLTRRRRRSAPPDQKDPVLRDPRAGSSPRIGRPPP